MYCIRLWSIAEASMVPQASMTFIYANKELWEQDWVDHDS